MSLLHYVLRYVHITGGMIGLASGSVAMTVRKGSGVHARAGQVFTVSMLVMASAGATIAYFINPVRGNALGGLLTFYLVLTAWATVWRKPARTGLIERIGAMLGLAVAIIGFSWGLAARQAARGMLDGYPATMYFIFAAVALLGVVLDLRFITRGGLAGAARTTRHLWRMCFAMFVATGSFFLGQAKLFPAPVRESGVLRLPVIAVVCALIYWLIRVRILPSIRRPRVSDAARRPT